jgi:hypothetical protein
MQCLQAAWASMRSQVCHTCQQLRLQPLLGGPTHHCCCAALADPPAGDVGTNAQYAACPAKEAPAAVRTNSYSYGQALVVSAPAAAGRVKGPFSVPAGVLSAECLGVSQVGFMARVPASLKVSCTGRLCS